VLTEQGESLSTGADAGAETGMMRMGGGARAAASPQSMPQGSPVEQTLAPTASTVVQELKPDTDLRALQPGQAGRDPGAGEQAAVQAGAPRAESTAKAGVKQSSAAVSSVQSVHTAEHAAPIQGGAEVRAVQMAAPTVDRSTDTGHAAEALRGGNNEVFAALDASGAPATNWVHAGARHAEAGYLDPALGWVGVRAETAGAAVHATIVPMSADAAQMLGSHMPALSAYMAEHSAAATRVTMAAPEMGMAGQGSNHQMAGDNGQRQPQQDVRIDAVDTSGPALRGRTPESSVAISSIPPIGFGHGATISLVA